MNDLKLVEIRFHGRGGQGVVTAAEIFVNAALKAGLWGQTFPSFGAERRGAPVTAYARISRSRIRCRSVITEPDVVVVLDPKLPSVVDVFQGLKDNGVIVLNTDGQGIRCEQRYKTFYVNANEIARKLGLVLAGWPLVNTAMLGALLRATRLFSISCLLDSVKDYIHGDLLTSNLKAVEEAYELTKVC